MSPVLSRMYSHAFSLTVLAPNRDIATSSYWTINGSFSALYHLSALLTALEPCLRRIYARSTMIDGTLRYVVPFLPNATIVAT